jgi:radical SAM superfamily enzyme with C-terminal helix-hairpin-helix motif
MKKRFRTFIAAATGLALCACANPYADQLARLDARYASGKISKKAYREERDYLEVQKDRTDRENLRTGLAAAAIGTAIAGTVVASQYNRGPRTPVSRGAGGPPRR